MARVSRATRSLKTKTVSTKIESTLYPKIASFVEAILQEDSLITSARKDRLDRLAKYIRQCQNQEVPILLNFICTHNSRRSHMGQIWGAVAAHYFGFSNVKTYSGGTEATAFNPRAVAALGRVGFQIENPGGDNPHYQVSFAEGQPALECFSKVYDDPFNPEKAYAAIMTCSDAEENCPFIPGVSYRLSLTYDDPKVADDTPEEATRYDERLRQIGREVFHAFQLV